MLTLPGPLSVQTNLPQIPHTFTEVQAEMINPPLLFNHLQFHNYVLPVFFSLLYAECLYLFVYLFIFKSFGRGSAGVFWIIDLLHNLSLSFNA